MTRLIDTEANSVLDQGHEEVCAHVGIICIFSRVLSPGDGGNA